MISSERVSSSFYRLAPDGSVGVVRRSFSPLHVPSPCFGPSHGRDFRRPDLRSVFPRCIAWTTGGVANFYGQDIWPGLLLWFAASSVYVTVHVVLWTNREGWQKSSRYVAACLVMAVPPFGILGWAHPITAAGVLFPRWGWCGLIVMAAASPS